MRTFLAAILLAALIVGGVAIVVPLIARPMIVAAVLGASPLEGEPLDVDVDCNVFGLLTGTVDKVHVRGSDLTRDDAAIGALDITATDVATSGHRFTKVTGTLVGVTFPLDDGTSLTVDHVTLIGPSSSTTATATLDSTAAARLIGAAFADAGIDVTGIELGNGTIAFESFGARVEVPVGVEEGALVVVDPFGTGSLEVLRPGTDVGWVLLGVAVTPGGMTVDTRVDVEVVLAPT